MVDFFFLYFAKYLAKHNDLVCPALYSEFQTGYLYWQVFPDITKTVNQHEVLIDALMPATF